MRAFISKIIERVRLVPVLPLVALAGMAMIAYGITLLFGVPGGIIAGGVLLILAVVDSRAEWGRGET